MKHIIKSLSLALFIGSPIIHGATVKFATTAITVSQTDGAVDIPITMTGAVTPDNPLTFGYYPTFFYCSTQAGTTRNGVGYEGFTKKEVYFSKYNNTSETRTISIPIYFKNDPESKFFTVVLSRYDLGTEGEADIGTPSSVTVTVLGYQPPVPPVVIVPPVVPPPIDQTAPLLALSSKFVTRAQMILRGTASDASGISRVQYQLGRGPLKTATGTEAWSLKVPLKKGVNAISIFATDTAGNVSVSKFIKIRRK